MGITIPCSHCKQWDEVGGMRLYFYAGALLCTTCQADPALTDYYEGHELEGLEKAEYELILEGRYD